MPRIARPGIIRRLIIRHLPKEAHMFKSLLATGIAAIFALATSVASAADQSPKYPDQPSTTKPSDQTEHRKMEDQEFKSLDKDGDGKIEQAEIRADSPLAGHFMQLDSDKDGSLSKREFAKHHEQRSANP
jgi:hypothetical protein